MSGAAFLRVAKLNKGPGHLLVAARHNRREIAAEIGAGGSIDPARSHLNFTLQGPDTAAGVAAQATLLMAAAGVSVKRKDGVHALELVFSLPVGMTVDVRDYFAACVRWASDYFGCPVLSADVHMDEACPHCHVLVLPLVDGRMCGSDLLGGPGRFQAMHQSFGAVAGGFGLKREARLRGDSRAKGAAAVLAWLRQHQDPVMQSALWHELRASIEENPAPFMLALSIERDAKPSKRLRTVAEIFTSKGKGADKRKASNPIGFAQLKDVNPIGFGGRDVEPYTVAERTLCSVGFAFPGDTDFRPFIPVDQPERLEGAMLEAIRKKAVKRLRAMPVGEGFDVLVRAGHACGLTVDELAQWAGDRERVDAVLAGGVGHWRAFFEIGPGDARG